MANAKTATFTVAPGRTVNDGTKDFGPGAEITLDADEGKRLQDIGFLVGEDGTVTVNTNGPAVNVEDGVRVKEA